MTGCLSDDAEIINSILFHNCWLSKTSALVFLDINKKLKLQNRFQHILENI